MTAHSRLQSGVSLFFFNDTAPTEIYTLSLHDALPISSPAFTIASETLKLKTGMPGVAIPFKGSNESNLCVVSEQCLFTISDGPPAIPLVKGGKSRALAVTGAERSPELPDVPS